MLAIQSFQMAEGTFAARLRAIREARGLSQRELAKRSGLDAGHIGRLETSPLHEPRSKTKKALAEALGVSLSELEDAPSKRSWKADFALDPAYSAEVKKVILQLAEAEEKRLLQKKRK